MSAATGNNMSAEVATRPPLLDAFFWLEPVREDVRKPFNSARVVWQFPDNNNPLADEIAVIAQYCFPDLHVLSLENVKSVPSAKSDVSDSGTDSFFFTFRAKNNSNALYHGVVLRYLFRGMLRRFDANRRVRHALCLVSRYPLFSFFQGMLRYVYSFGLLESFVRQSKAFSEHMFNFMLSHPGHAVFRMHHPTHLPKHLLSTLHTPEFSWVVPAQNKTYFKEARMLPLLQKLGVDKFFKLLSALLTEQSVIFLSDHAHAVTHAVLAAARALHPLRWQHSLTTLLPRTQLLALLQRREPFLAGMLRVPVHELLQQMQRVNPRGVLVVDVDAGELFAEGVALRDLVGDAGNVLKQATESLDRVRANVAAGVASVLMNKSGTSKSGKIDSANDPLAGSARDLMAMLVQDLKSSLSSEPGSASFTAMTSGLLRSMTSSAASTAKTTAEARMLWTYEAEKTIIESLACLYVFLLHDLRDFVVVNPHKKTASQSARDSASVRERLHWAPFLQRKRLSGASPSLLELLEDLSYTQMLYALLEEKVLSPAPVPSLTQTQAQTAGRERMSRSASLSLTATDTGAGSECVCPEADELFDVVVADLRAFSSSPSLSHSARAQLSQSNAQADRERGVVTATAVKQRVTARTSLGLSLSESDAQPHAQSQKLSTSALHIYTLQFTATQLTQALDAELESLCVEHAEDFGLYFSLCVSGGVGNAVSRQSRTQAHTQALATLERVLRDVYTQEGLVRVFATLSFRLETCKAANWRGNAGISGLKALQLLQILLVQGPLQTISYALDLQPLLCQLLHTTHTPTATQAQTGTQQANTAQPSLEMLSSSLAASVSLSSSSSAPLNARPLLLATLSLLVDHRKLIAQRSMVTLAQNATTQTQPLLQRLATAVPASLTHAQAPTQTGTANVRGTQTRTQPSVSVSVNVQRVDVSRLNTNGNSALSTFAKMHNALRPSSQSSVRKGVLILSPPERVSVEREADDDNETDYSSVANTNSNTNTRRNTRSESAASSSFSQTQPYSHTPAQPHKQQASPVDLLGLGDVSFDEERSELDPDGMAYVENMRDAAPLSQPSPTQTQGQGQTQAQGQSSSSIKLAPPPAVSTNKNRKAPNNGNNAANVVPASVSASHDPWAESDPFAPAHNKLASVGVTGSPVRSNAASAVSSVSSGSTANSSYLADLSSLSLPPPVPAHTLAQGNRSVSPVPVTMRSPPPRPQGFIQTTRTPHAAQQEMDPFAHLTASPARK